LQLHSLLVNFLFTVYSYYEEPIGNPAVLSSRQTAQWNTIKTLVLHVCTVVDCRDETEALAVAEQTYVAGGLRGNFHHLYSQIYGNKKQLKIQ